MVGKREDLAICVPEALCEEGDRKLLLFLNALGLFDYKKITSSSNSDSNYLFLNIYYVLFDMHF